VYSLAAESAACVSCATLAVADAGVAMLDLVAACSMCCVNGIEVLDPTALEEQNSSGTLFVSYMPRIQRISHVDLSGVAWEGDATTQVCFSMCSVNRTTLTPTVVGCPKGGNSV